MKKIQRRSKHLQGKNMNRKKNKKIKMIRKKMKTKEKLLWTTICNQFQRMKMMKYRGSEESTRMKNLLIILPKMTRKELKR